MTQLKKEALNVLVNYLQEDEILHLKQTFQTIDKDKTGMLNTAELESAFQKLERKSPSALKVRQIMAKVDYRGNGKINYSEFIAATISV